MRVLDAIIISHIICDCVKHYEYVHLLNIYRRLFQNEREPFIDAIYDARKRVPGLKIEEESIEREREREKRF